MRLQGHVINLKQKNTVRVTKSKKSNKKYYMRIMMSI